MAIRDFSDEKKDELIRAIKSNTDPMPPSTVNFSEYHSAFSPQTLAASENLYDDTRKMLTDIHERKEDSVYQINQIFINANNDDAAYAKKFAKKNEILQKIVDDIKKLTDLIQPNAAGVSPLTLPKSEFAQKMKDAKFDTSIQTDIAKEYYNSVLLNEDGSINFNGVSKLLAANPASNMQYEAMGFLIDDIQAQIDSGDVDAAYASLDKILAFAYTDDKNGSYILKPVLKEFGEKWKADGKDSSIYAAIIQLPASYYHNTYTSKKGGFYNGKEYGVDFNLEMNTSAKDFGKNYSVPPEFRKSGAPDALSQLRSSFFMLAGVGAMAVADEKDGTELYEDGAALLDNIPAEEAAAAAENEKYLVDVPTDIDSLNDNNISHIMAEKHDWYKLVDNPTWENIKPLLDNAIKNIDFSNFDDEQVIYEVVKINGEDVSINGMWKDGLFKIGDAWVVK